MLGFSKSTNIITMYIFYLTPINITINGLIAYFNSKQFRTQILKNQIHLFLWVGVHEINNNK